MHFHAPHAALKLKSSPNVQPIDSYFHSLHKFLQRHIFELILQMFQVVSVWYMRAINFLFFILFTFKGYMYKMFM